MYRQELADKIVKLVGQGYCLKDVAYFCGLSDRTILRWRETHLDFNEDFVKATQRSGKRTCTKWSILVQEIDLNYYPYEPIVNDRFMFCLPNLHPTTPQDELSASPTFHPFHTHSVRIEIVRNTFGVRRHRSWVNR